MQNREERVDWESGRNLRGADSIEQARRRFRRVAAHKARQVEAPLYQIILSWQSGNDEKGIPPDDPSREMMEWAVDEVLLELGLEEHQAWIVAHRDTSTPHVHTVVNRIHPRSAETWEPPSYYKSILYNKLRELEKMVGWHRPGPMNIQDLPESRRRHLEYWEEEVEKFGRARSVRRWAREEGIADLLKAATSWERAEKILFGTGARLQPRRENGMVLERGDGHAALSGIDPEISRPKLEDLYIQAWDDYSQKSKTPSDRLSETAGEGFSPTEKQFKAYRLVEKIEAIRRAERLRPNDRQVQSAARLQKEKARAALVAMADALRQTPPERETNLKALEGKLSDSSAKILERARLQGALWAVGASPTEKMDSATEEASNEGAFNEKTPNEGIPKEGPLAERGIGTLEYIKRRVGAPAEAARRLDETVPCRRLRLHRETLTRRLADLQRETLRVNEEVRKANEALSEATDRLTEALSREDGKAARAAYEKIKETLRKRRESEETFRGKLQDRRREQARELEATSRILAERKGGAEEEELSARYRWARRRAHVLQEWRRRLGEQQSVDYTAGQALRAYAEKAPHLEKVPHLEGAPGEDRLEKLREEISPTAGGGEEEEEADQVEEADRAKEARDLQEKAFRRLQAIEAVAEEAGLSLSGNPADSTWAENILPQEDAPLDMTQSGEEIPFRDGTPLEEGRKGQREPLGKREPIGEDPVPIEARSTDRLKRDLRRLASRQRADRREVLGRVRHAEKENAALESQVDRMREVIQEGSRRQETAQSGEVGQLSGSPSLLEVVQARIEKRRALKTEVEKAIAEGRRRIEAQETEISEIEKTLAERGEKSAGSAPLQRLQEKGQVLSRLQDLEQQRREIVTAQLEALGLAQQQGGDQDGPGRFDPSRQRERLEQIAGRAKEAEDRFREQAEAVAEEADQARGPAETTERAGAPMTQMKADLREVARAEKDAREAFEKLFEKPLEARRRFDGEAHLEGVGGRTWSSDRARWQLSANPEEYGTLVGNEAEGGRPRRAKGKTGPKDKAEPASDPAAKAARAQQAVDKKRRAFRKKYDGRRPAQAAEDLLPKGQARRVLSEMPTGRVLSPEVRKAAAEAARAAAERQAEREEEAFLQAAKKRFINEEQAVEAFRKNKAMCGGEIACRVLVQPSGYRVGEDTRLHDPGQVLSTRDDAQSRMEEIGRTILKHERRARLLGRAEKTAMIQWLEKHLQEGRLVVDTQKEAPTLKQTTLSRVAQRGISSQGLPYNRDLSPVEEDSVTDDSVEKDSRKEDPQFGSAREVFESQARDRRPTEQVWEAMSVVKEARRAEQARAMKRDLDRAWSEDTSLKDQKRVLLGALKKQGLPSKQGLSSKKARAVLRQVEEGREAGEAIRETLGPEPEKTDVPESIQAAAQRIASLGRGPEKGRATRLISEGVQSENGVLREAGILELKRSLRRKQSGEGSRRDEEAKKRAAKLRQRAGEQDTLRSHPEGYDLRLKEQLRAMTETEQALLKRRARASEQAQEALDRAQNPGRFEEERKKRERLRRETGRAQSLPTKSRSQTKSSRSADSHTKDSQTEDSQTEPPQSGTEEKSQKDQDGDQQTPERRRGRDWGGRGR